MKRARRRVDVNLEELDHLLDRARQEPLSEPECEKIKSTLHALVEALTQPRTRTTEKTKAVFGSTPAAATEPETESDSGKPGHGRNGAAAFEAAPKIKVAHEQLKSGDPCPECPKGKVYAQKEPKVLIRVIGQAPVAATTYELERLRCNLCGQIFTAQEPDGVGAEKYDETVASMVAQLKYGSGMPFHRLEALEKRLGVPLPASTQWEIVEEAAELVKPARDELIRQAAGGEVLHNDDTSMKVLKLERPPGDERTGVFTSGIVSVGAGRRIALFFTGRQHAGENLADVLKQRAAAAQPVQMCDALSRNPAKPESGVEILLANCLAHGRRQFVEIAGNFPEECRHVLEVLGAVYHNDALARRQSLTPEERLRFHQERSGPMMEELHQWLEAHLAQHRVEPNSGLGKAIRYLLRHWKPLTLFLRHAGAPLDNNVCERALKKAVLHRKNALFYRTTNGAEAGDLFMTLIHTCELNGVNSFDYLTELQRHAAEMAARPADWMPWNYRITLSTATAK